MDLGIKIPQSVLGQIKELELKIEMLKKDFDILNLQKQNLILNIFVDHKLPKNANINPDGTVTCPEPIPGPVPIESSLEFHNEGAV